MTNYQYLKEVFNKRYAERSYMQNLSLDDMVQRILFSNTPTSSCLYCIYYNPNSACRKRLYECENGVREYLESEVNNMVRTLRIDVSENKYYIEFDGIRLVFEDDKLAGWYNPYLDRVV